MKFLRQEDAKNTKFIEIFNDGSGVFARPLTESERDKLRLQSRRFESGESRTDEVVERKYRILYLQKALSGWENFEYDDGAAIPFSPEAIKALWAVNPNRMNIIYNMISNEFAFVDESEEKNSAGGPTA